jgi:hypothetical protein
MSWSPNTHLHSMLSLTCESARTRNRNSMLSNGAGSGTRRGLLTPRPRAPRRLPRRPHCPPA